VEAELREEKILSARLKMQEGPQAKGGRQPPEMILP
jgi:hypothetical protein